MAKTEKLRALARIDYNGGVYLPGTDEDVFDCDNKEASRLKSLGIAETFQTKPVSASKEHLAKTALLADIAAASTTDELLGLLSEEQPDDDDIRDAISSRLAALEGE